MLLTTDSYELTRGRSTPDISQAQVLSCLPLALPFSGRYNLWAWQAQCNDMAVISRQLCCRCKKELGGWCSRWGLMGGTGGDLSMDLECNCPLSSTNAGGGLRPGHNPPSYF